MRQEVLRAVAAESGLRIQEALEGQEYFADPYKHVILDNFFPTMMADQALSGFPSIDGGAWDEANDEDIEIKHRSNWTSEFDIPDPILPIVRVMNSAPILKAMAKRFDIEKVIPDPYFAGGGLNVMKPGGLLDVHVDGNYHDATGLNRRLNALLYLNPAWQEGWNGEFGIYDEGGRNCVKKVAPLHNRLVIFETHDRSYHGLPDPLNFPSGEYRRSVILYYYTKAPRPDEQVVISEPHSALWVKRNMHDKRGNQTREYS